jgi:hypothetical protein
MRRRIASINHLPHHGIAAEVLLVVVRAHMIDSLCQTSASEEIRKVGEVITRFSRNRKRRG